MKLFNIIFIFCIIIVLSHGLPAYYSPINIKEQQSFQNIWNADIILADSKDPYYCLLASTLACYYPHQTNTSILTPLLVISDNKITDQHERFIISLKNDPNLLCIGANLSFQYNTISFQEQAPELSLILASKFLPHSEVIITPYGSGKNYTISLQATLLSCYLNIPLLILNDNFKEINGYLKDNTIKEVYIFGDIDPDRVETEHKILLNNEQIISHQILQIIKNKFELMDYITLTNPIDIKKPEIISTMTIELKRKVSHQSITLLGKTITIKGDPTYYFNISIPSGIHHLQCSMQYQQNTHQQIINEIEPLLYCRLQDPNGTIVGYSQSSSFDIGKINVDTLIVDHPGDYVLEISPYQGFKGGYFSSRGFSLVNGDLTGNITIETLNTSHYPLVGSLSVMAPYLTASYGGYLIANESFSLTNPEYDIIAKGYSSGPYYEEDLHEFNNDIVNGTLDEINRHLDYLKAYDLYKSFIEGPAWLAILGDTNMIPMYYYQPSQSGLIEKGLPSDNPYSYHELFSIGRLMGYSVDDVSILISRTLFYQSICDESNNSKWKETFHFMYGEGFGETGGWFHQIPYAKKIEQYGFSIEVFGVFKNSRQYAERHQVFTQANYNEYLGHGDWFWFTPSWYGFDVYIRSFDVSHLKNWIFEHPSVFLTSACLMGRVDGISPEMNIGMTLLHAGCISFVGATRETGQEAGLEILENSLIINDTSIGEALREEKITDQVLPTYYVRVLFGDPAFNPYEPNNGFTIERRPTQKRIL